MKKLIILIALAALSLIATAAVADTTPVTLYWVDPLELRAVDASLTVTPADKAGWSVLEIAPAVQVNPLNVGDKEVAMGVTVPPWNLVTGIKLCYEINNAASASYLSQMAITQLQNSLANPVVVLNDSADRLGVGPVCVESIAAPTPINPASGALQLNFALNFADPADKFVVRSLALVLVPDPASPMQQQIDALKQNLDALKLQVMNHTHTYLTGKGVGHNNVQATTSATKLPPVPTPYTAPAPTSTKKK